MSKYPNGGPSLVQAIRQSPPIDTSEPYDPAWVAGRTILITGGASGFGEGFFRKWAAHGANIIIGDINDKRGEAIVEEVRESTGNKNHHYIHCNVTDWQSQVDFFHKAIKLSVHGGIDAVVTNAGVIEKGARFEKPEGLDAEAPPKPNLLCFDVNMTGVLYTAHLALFYLPRNPRSQNPSLSNIPAANTPGKSLLYCSILLELSDSFL
jgi:NAD(P)-dependent dehydrogenase (short-subunit alcohol dehydrogenase family)